MGKINSLSNKNNELITHIKKETRMINNNIIRKNQVAELIRILKHVSEIERLTPIII